MWLHGLNRIGAHRGSACLGPRGNEANVGRSAGSEGPIDAYVVVAIPLSFLI
jgi:hypothetical protein